MLELKTQQGLGSKQHGWVNKDKKIIGIYNVCSKIL